MRKIAIILILAALLRIYGMNWDAGYHLHPDERMIIMVADRIHFFDKLNPDFFNYGSLPIYLLKGVSQVIDAFFSSNTSSYQGMLFVGRWLSVFFDIGTVFLIYRIALLLFKKERIALFSSFLYAIAFFPIQNAHFFTVDILFTFLTTLLLYLCIGKRLYSMKTVCIAITFAALFATKFTAIIFLPVILLSLFIHRKSFLYFILNSAYFILVFLIFYFFFMPFAFLDFFKFHSDISMQLKMNSDPYIFPYTLQYVGTTAYLYHLKNIFLWGLGPVTSVLALFGAFKFSKSAIHKNTSLILAICYYLLYFVIIGMSAVKFMRYMLPVYPFLAIVAGYGLFNICSRFKRAILLLAVVWALLFIGIYSRPNTRVAASDWIVKNIPKGSALAVEYWDDYLPLYNVENYRLNELHLYDLPDDTFKWQRLNMQLASSDYIIVSSNRLYTPLQKLRSCPNERSCYPKTAEYYKELFSGKRGFKKVKEFTNYPKLEIGALRLEIPDDSADESFTVFDHPQVMIFKKT